MPDSEPNLASYIVSLARAHGVSPRRLIEIELAAKDPDIKKLGYASFYRRHAGTINGLGLYARKFSGVVAALTGHADVARMTCVSLSDLVPANGAGLLARHPRWCKECLKVAVADGIEAVFPLLWYLELYRCCPLHNAMLTDRCPSCDKLQPFLPRYPDLTACASCGSCLAHAKKDKATESPEPSKVSILDRWCANALADLVDGIEADTSVPSRSRFVAAIKLVAKSKTNGNMAALCRQMGLQPWAFNRWIREGEKPSLPQVLDACYRLNLEPAVVFSAGWQEHIAENGEPRRSSRILVARDAKCSPAAEARESIGKKFKRIAEDSNDARSLVAIGLELEVSRQALKYWFPDLCVLARQKFFAHRITAANTTIQQRKGIVTAVLARMRAENRYPSRRRVESALRNSKLSLALKDVRAMYCEGRRTV